MPDLASLYTDIAEIALAKLNLQQGNITLTDLIPVKALFDINEVLIGIDLKNGQDNEVDYEKGLGLRNDEGLQQLLEHFDVFEVITGRDEAYRYMRADTSDDLVKIKVHVGPDSDGWVDEFFDFNTLEAAEWDEVIDYDALDAFFESATFLVAPGREGGDAPDMYLWDDYDEVRDRLQQAQENNEELFGYTLIEAEGEGYIDKGFRLVNRLGYFLADKDIEMNEPIRYW